MRSSSICGVVRPSGRSGESSDNSPWICSSVSSGTSSGRRFGPVGVAERNSRVTDSGRSSVTLRRLRFCGVSSLGSSAGIPSIVADDPGRRLPRRRPAACPAAATALVACDCSSASLSSRRAPRAQLRRRFASARRQRHRIPRRLASFARIARHARSRRRRLRQRHRRRRLDWRRRRHAARPHRVPLGSRRRRRRWRHLARALRPRLLRLMQHLRRSRPFGPTWAPRTPRSSRAANPRRAPTVRRASSRPGPREPNRRTACRAAARTARAPSRTRPARRRDSLSA